MADSKRTTLGETLRSERKRRGWDIPRMAQQLRDASDQPHKMPSSASIQRNIERWEAGQVTRLSERYRLLYATAFDIPDERLFPPGQPQQAPTDGTHDEDVERRRLLQALVALGAVASPALDALHHIQDSVDRAIGVDAGLHLEEWEETVAEYGYTYSSTPAQKLLPDVAADLVTVRTAMSRLKTSDRLFPSWCRVTSGLAVLMAKTMSDLSQPREARMWWVTAQQAADASGDSDLSLWIGAERLVYGMYEQRPIPLLLRKADDIAGRAPQTPCRGLTHLLTVRAQLLALDGREDAARAGLRQCGQVFGQLPDTITKDTRSLAGWSEYRLRYTETWVYAYLGELAQLDTSANRARSLLTSKHRLGPTQLSLLQAFARVREGDVTEGVRSAQSVYGEHPAEFRTVMVKSLAGLVLDAVPSTQRTESMVSGYRELLADHQRRAIT